MEKALCSRAPPASSTRCAAADAVLAVDRPGAVLFDLDGLLVDSEPLWTVAEERVAARYGGVFTPELKARMIGKRLDLAVEVLMEGLDTPQARDAAPTEVADLLMAEMVTLLASGARCSQAHSSCWTRWRPRRCRWLWSRPRSESSSTLHSRMSAAARFTVSIAGDEVSRGKPDPEPYLTAARRLGVVPARCVVLEDAPAGLASAIAAGCACVLRPDDCRPKRRRRRSQMRQTLATSRSRSAPFDAEACVRWTSICSVRSVCIRIPGLLGECAADLLHLNWRDSAVQCPGQQPGKRMLWLRAEGQFEGDGRQRPVAAHKGRPRQRRQQLGVVRRKDQRRQLAADGQEPVDEFVRAPADDLIAHGRGRGGRRSGVPPQQA